MPIFYSMEWCQIECPDEQCTPRQRRAIHRFKVSGEIFRFMTKQEADQTIKLLLKAYERYQESHGNSFLRDIGVGDA